MYHYDPVTGGHILNRDHVAKVTAGDAILAIPIDNIQMMTRMREDRATLKGWEMSKEHVFGMVYPILYSKNLNWNQNLGNILKNKVQYYKFYTNLVSTVFSFFTWRTGTLNNWVWSKDISQVFFLDVSNPGFFPQNPTYYSWLVSHYEPWETDLTLAKLNAEEAGLLKTIFHDGLQLLPDQDWFFDRKGEERSGGELDPFSMRTFMIPISGLVFGMSMAGVAFVVESLM